MVDTQWNHFEITRKVMISIKNRADIWISMNWFEVDLRKPWHQPWLFTFNNMLKQLTMATITMIMTMICFKKSQDENICMRIERAPDNKEHPNEQLTISRDIRLLVLPFAVRHSHDWIRCMEESEVSALAVPWDTNRSTRKSQSIYAKHKKKPLYRCNDEPTVHTERRRESSMENVLCML